MTPKVAMNELQAVVSEVVKRFSFISKSAEQKIITFVCNAARRTDKRVPVEVLISEVEAMLVECGKKNTKVTNKVLSSMGNAFRTKLIERYGSRSSALENGHEPLLELIAWIGCTNSTDFTNCHIYRVQNLWCIIRRFGISSDVLQQLFPANILEVIEYNESSKWNDFLGIWVIQMFYFKYLGYLISFEVCSEIWNIFSSWEKAASLPLEITFLSFETLATFLPPPEIIKSCPCPSCLKYWRERSQKSALCRLRAFPFQDINAQPDYCRFNPYSDEGPDYLSAFESGLLAK
eukprot:TRINITY_DN9961_c0_g1_i1.p1 TRINITY_DN9961_c0_g1~~TRINITY_DN9961_c0_g1_i1.p1  ORF type:complete len:291 (+),score=42.33 TRINITY_DN9961_c0_g1_i1:78-950(+)